MEFQMLTVGSFGSSNSFEVKVVWAVQIPKAVYNFQLKGAKALALGRC